MIGNRTIAALILSALVFGACGKKDDDKKGGSGSGDAGPAQSVEVGKEFSLNGDLARDGEGYTLQRNFAFGLQDSKVLRIAERSSVYKCEGDGDLMPIFMVSSADGSIKVASAEIEGFKYVEGSFPGALPSGTFSLSILYFSGSPCQIIGANLVLEAVDAQNPSPDTDGPDSPSTPSPGPTPVPTSTPSPTPTPIPDPTPAPTPAPAAFDSRLVGTWRTEMTGVFSDTMTFAADGKGRDKIIVEGSVYVDLELTVDTDIQKSPAQLTMTVTNILQKSADADVSVGDKNYCIYQVISATELKLECDASMPSGFTDEAQTFTKQ